MAEVLSVSSAINNDSLTSSTTTNTTSSVAPLAEMLVFRIDLDWDNQTETTVKCSELIQLASNKFLRKQKKENTAPATKPQQVAVDDNDEGELELDLNGNLAIPDAKQSKKRKNREVDDIDLNNDDDIDMDENDSSDEEDLKDFITGDETDETSKTDAGNGKSYDEIEHELDEEEYRSKKPTSRLAQVIRSIEERENAMKSALLQRSFRKSTVPNTEEKNETRTRADYYEYEEGDGFFDDAEFEEFMHHDDQPIDEDTEKYGLYFIKQIVDKSQQEETEDGETAAQEEAPFEYKSVVISVGKDVLEKENRIREKRKQQLEQQQNMEEDKNFKVTDNMANALAKLEAKAKTLSTEAIDSQFISKDLYDELLEVAKIRVVDFPAGVPNALIKRMQKIPGLRGFADITLKTKLKALLEQSLLSETEQAIQKLKTDLVKSVLKDMTTALQKKGITEKKDPSTMIPMKEAEIKHLKEAGADDEYIETVRQVRNESHVKVLKSDETKRILKELATKTTEQLRMTIKANAAAKKKKPDLKIETLLSNLANEIKYLWPNPDPKLNKFLEKAIGIGGGDNTEDNAETKAGEGESNQAEKKDKRKRGRPKADEAANIVNNAEEKETNVEEKQQQPEQKKQKKDKKAKEDVEEPNNKPVEVIEFPAVQPSSSVVDTSDVANKTEKETTSKRERRKKVDTEPKEIAQEKKKKDAEPSDAQPKDAAEVKLTDENEEPKKEEKKKKKKEKQAKDNSEPKKEKKRKKKDEGENKEQNEEKTKKKQKKSAAPSQAQSSSTGQRKRKSIDVLDSLSKLPQDQPREVIDVSDAPTPVPNTTSVTPTSPFEIPQQTPSITPARTLPTPPKPFQFPFISNFNPAMYLSMFNLQNTPSNSNTTNANNNNNTQAKK